MLNDKIARMHWADKIAETIVSSGKFKPYFIDDMKTPSGFAHVGSLLGPILHSAIFRAIKSLGKEARFTYVFNDFDAADEFPPEFKNELSKHIGEPLKKVPSPDPEFSNLADLLASDFRSVMNTLGVEAEYLSSWDMYKEGKFDGVIKEALDNAEKIQDIYKRVSGSSKKESGWLPLQVICENCGKLGTTRVYAWDGEKVSYKCEPKLVTWAEGCGHNGKISPFGGNGKLPWKVDWAAHWKVLGITIEGAGKDHASAGGSYDIAHALCREVFKYPEPYKIPYEFLLIGGKKMSSSRGLGLKAHDIVKILPASVARFLFIRKDYREQANFDPEGSMAIPDLFDEYDKAWEAYDKGGDEKLARTYLLSQTGKIPEKEKGFFAPRFRDIANFLSQGLTEDELISKFTEEKKGRVDDSELSVLEERIKFARFWLKDYAPREFNYEMTKTAPDEVKSLTAKQKEYLKAIVDIYNEGETPESLQISLYELAKERKIPTKEAFLAIYLTFIGKREGPRAGILLSGFGRKKVVDRIKEATK